jgi:hypothetical protein
MRVIRVVKKKPMAKLVMTLLAVASVATLISGGMLMNPILIGAGVAGLFLSCGAVVSMKRRTALDYV